MAAAFRQCCITCVFLVLSACAVDEPSNPNQQPSFAIMTSGNRYYVADHDPSSSYPGTITQPWPLHFALRGAGGVIQAGDTVWIRGGTYRGDPAGAQGKGKDIVTVSTGQPSVPILFRAYAGERPILQDSTVGAPGTDSGKSQLNVQTGNLVFVGLEFTNIHPNRTTVRPDMIYNNAGANNNVYDQLVIHDGGVGFYNDPAASNVMIQNSVIYNIGYQGTDRGHGHGIYLRSNIGHVWAAGNAIFNTFGYGIHAYTDPGAGKLIRIILSSNVVFNSGTLSNNSNEANILLGGSDFADADTVAYNATYFTPGYGKINVQFGYGTFGNGSIYVRSGNYFVGGKTVLDIGYWGAQSFTWDWEQTFAGSDTIVAMHDSTTFGGGDPAIGMTFYRDTMATAWTYGNVAGNLPWWRAATGVDNSPENMKPPTVEGRYGGAFLRIFHIGNQSSFSGAHFRVCSANGQTYTVRNVQNLWGTPVTTGTCNLSQNISLPIQSATPPTPIGMAGPGPSTGTAFVVYRVDHP